MGFAGAVGQTVPIGATYIYRLNFFGGFIVSSLTYFILCKIWPAKAVPERWTEDGNQGVNGARLGHVRDDDSEQGNWKLNDDNDASGYEDHKLNPADNPTTSSL